MKKLLRLLFCICLIGCESQRLGNREKGALGGAALGAGLGAIVGNQVGSSGAGIAIGSAFGALSGAMIGNELDNSQAAIDAGSDRLAEQERVLEENRRLIEELRRGGMDVRETDRGVVVNLPDVLFEFGSAEMTGEARSNASRIADVIRDAGPRHVSIEGHTDSVGTLGYNQRLSEDRARSVAGALTANGIPRRQISTRGFGETDPIASNSTAQGRQRNRRVEVIIEN